MLPQAIARRALQATARLTAPCAEETGHIHAAAHSARTRTSTRALAGETARLTQVLQWEAFCSSPVQLEARAALQYATQSG